MVSPFHNVLWKKDKRNNQIYNQGIIISLRLTTCNEPTVVPIIGGPIAVALGALGLVFGSAMDLDQTFVFLTYGTFLLGGILCTLWGWQRRKEKRGQA